MKEEKIPKKDRRHWSGVALDQRWTSWRKIGEKECDLESFMQNSRAEQLDRQRSNFSVSPLEVRNSKTSPERKREIGEGNGGWSDGAKHDDRARSYKGVVINGNSGQQSKDRDGRDYNGKGKGKVFEAPGSKWVKAAERGQRRPSNHHGYYKGDSEGSRHKSVRREDGRHGATAAGTGIQEAHIRPSSGQYRADQVQRIPPKEAREDGEIRNTGEDDTLLPSLEFQLELAKTQAEGMEVILESTDEDNGLQMVRILVEQQEDQADNLEMEMDAINATLLENGVDMEAKEEFQTLSEEEAEQAELASRAQEEKVHTQEEEELMHEEADMEKGKGAGELALRQGSRKRLLKPSINTLGRNKMRAANALVSPRRKAAAKVGSRHGDGSKPPESKGPSITKPANLKFYGSSLTRRAGKNEESVGEVL
ncbi:hypothetical protein F2Q69_00006967 [Brassica cretica]|uniref:Uncharacterized protein n=1 Tax=Brassica cretica TaxID=69181 RepID=A0A8S9NLQ9_BRACR|nr:hypothetical protein F2Q69_00006967 [Brassica cretica]